ncbi:MAG: hypothetical protein C0443_13310 [Comamonadaceae bacterium]|nr:hypothetical protein [Comamonadaceae bacterium]
MPEFLFCTRRRSPAWRGFFAHLARLLSPHAPPLRGSLPPEGAGPCLGRPGAAAPLPPRSTAARVAAPRGAYALT